MALEWPQFQEFLKIVSDLIFLQNMATSKLLFGVQIKNCIKNKQTNKKRIVLALVKGNISFHTSWMEKENRLAEVGEASGRWILQENSNISQAIFPTYLSMRKIYYCSHLID